MSAKVSEGARAARAPAGHSNHPYECQDNQVARNIRGLEACRYQMTPHSLRVIK